MRRTGSVAQAAGRKARAAASVSSVPVVGRFWSAAAGRACAAASLRSVRRRDEGEFVLASGRAEERWRRKRGPGVAGWVCGVMLGAHKHSLACHVARFPDPRSRCHGSRAAIPILGAALAGAPAGAPCLQHQQPRPGPQPGRLGDENGLEGAGPHDGRLLPLPVFWCTYAHLLWLLLQLDAAWPTLNRRDVPRATTHYEPGCACPPCLSLWCVLTTSVTYLGPTLCAPTLLRPRPRLLSLLQYSFVVRPRRRGA